MKNSFSKGISYGALLVGIITSVVFFSCNKSETAPLLTPEQKLLSEKFIDQRSIFGEADLATVKSADNGDKNYYIIGASVRGSATKKLILVVDKRTANETHYIRYTFDNNFSPVQQENKIGDRFVELVSLDEKKVIRVNYKDGVNMTVNASNNSSATGEAPRNAITVSDPISDCIKASLSSLSIGEMIFFIITFPESYAGLLLACTMTWLMGVMTF